MTRRRSTQRAKVQIKREPWGEPFDRLFRLGKAGDWTPPAEVIIRMGTRTWSYVADFVDRDGAPFRCTVKIDPIRKEIVEERLDVAFRWKGGKA